VRRAAAEAMVLLANDGLLPLEANKLRRVAVVGPNAENLAIMGGGSARVVPHYLSSPLGVLKERLGDSAEVTYASGVGANGVADETSIKEAVASLAGADAVIVIVGTDGEWESEGHDRETMALPRNQGELVERVLAAHPRCAVVVNSGAPVGLEWATGASAILQTWFGGQETANAIVDVLLGDSEPGGRLPTTFPLHIENTPAFGNFPAESSTVRYGEGLLMGYRWYEARQLPVRFAFGHGLSYSRFFIGEPRLSARTLDPGGTLVVTVPVTNIGQRRGAEVVQLYVAPPDAGGSRPGGRFRALKELRGFAKVWLDPGETTTVRIDLNERSFSYYDVADTEWPSLHEKTPGAVFNHGEVSAPLHHSEPGWYVEDGSYELLIGRSSADIAHVVEITVTGSGRPLPGFMAPA
jgi:beta-glucosidase